MSVVPFEPLSGYRFSYKGITYNVLGVLLETLIQFEEKWEPTVRYTTDGTDKAFVRSLTEFQRKFFPLDAPIRYDGQYRPTMALDGSNFNVVKYDDVEPSYTGATDGGIREEFAMKRGGRRAIFGTYEEAKVFADKLNSGFKK